MGIIQDFRIGREVRKALQAEETFSDKSVNTLPNRSANNLLSRDASVFKNITGYSRNSIVNECVGIRSDALQSVPLQVFLKGTDEEVDCPLSQLLNNPNPFQDGETLLLYNEVFQSVGGNSYYHKVRNRMGIVFQLYPYHAAQISVVPSANSWITKYRYDSWGGERIDIPVEDITHFRWNSVNFARPGLSESPLMPLLKEIDIDNESAEIEITTLQNGMVIPFAILPSEKVNGGLPLTNDQIGAQLEKLRTRYGKKNRGLGMILNPGTTIVQTGISPKDFGNLTSRAIPETRIPAVFKVPLSKTGLYASISRVAESNRHEDEKTFARTMLSHMNKITKTLEHSFANEHFADGSIGSDYDIRFNSSLMPALIIEEQENRKIIRQEFEENVITLNEARLKLGYLEAPDGDKFLYELNPTSKISIGK